MSEEHARKRRRLSMWQTLSVEQRAIIVALRETRDSLFITGGAGVGKSLVLRTIIASLPLHGLAVTGSTGVAAAAIGGQTLHSWAGIGQGRESAADLLKSPFLRRGSKAHDRWCACDTVIVDEVSMISADLLDKLDAIARAIRKRPHDAFGGIRLILVGDPLQLPSVQGAMFYESAIWQALQPRVFELRFLHRQAGDLAFASMLQDIRLGHCSAETAAILQAHVDLPPPPADAIVMHLMPHNATADVHNASQLLKLPGKCVTHVARDTGNVAMLETQLVPHDLHLKVGAQVMLLKNLSVLDGLYNGTQGVVTGFSHAERLPIVRFENGRVRALDVTNFDVERDRVIVATRHQIPLKLSWACTIHKVQSLTITSLVEINLGRDVFAVGMAYVALSRLQRLDQLRLSAFAPASIRAHPGVLAWLTRAVAQAPVVLG